MILSECLEMRTGIWVQLYPEKAIKRVHTPDFPGGTDSKASVYNAGDPGSIPGLVRSPGEGSCLKNPHGKRSLAGYSSCGHKSRT